MLNTNRITTWLVGAITISLIAACGGNSTPSAAPAVPTTSNAPTQAPLTNKPTDVPVATTAPAKAPEPTKVAAPALPTGDAKAAIVAAQKKSITQPYRTKTTVQSSNGNTEINGEFVPPNKFHVMTKSAFDGRDTTTEMIVVENTMWMRLNGNAWTKTPAAKATLDALQNSITDEMAGAISDAKLVGADVINGTPTFLYSYKLDWKGVKSSNKVWIGAANGLPLKQEIAGEFANVKSLTTQTIEYDSSIKIEAPNL